MRKASIIPSNGNASDLSHSHDSSLALEIMKYSLLCFFVLSCLMGMVWVCYGINSCVSPFIFSSDSFACSPLGIFLFYSFVFEIFFKVFVRWLFFNPISPSLFTPRSPFPLQRSLFFCLLCFLPFPLSRSYIYGQREVGIRYSNVGVLG